MSKHELRDVSERIKKKRMNRYLLSSKSNYWHDDRNQHFGPTIISFHYSFSVIQHCMKCIWFLSCVSCNNNNKATTKMKERRTMTVFQRNIQFLIFSVARINLELVPQWYIAHFASCFTPHHDSDGKEVSLYTKYLFCETLHDLTHLVFFKTQK